MITCSIFVMTGKSGSSSPSANIPWRAGDELAQYGLTALVVGGVGAALVKSGLLARLWKPIVLGLAALGAGLKRVFFSGRSAHHHPEAPIT